MKPVGKAIIGTGWLLLIVGAGFGGLHLGAGVCPVAGRQVAADRRIPVVYGLPTAEGLEAARAGKIALGGCVPGPVTFLCPHCRWPIAPGPPAGS